MAWKLSLPNRFDPDAPLTEAYARIDNFTYDRRARQVVILYGLYASKAAFDADCSPIDIREYRMPPQAEGDPVVSWEELMSRHGTLLTQLAAALYTETAVLDLFADAQPA